MPLFKKDPKNSNLVTSGIFAGVLEVIYIALLISIGSKVAETFQDRFVGDEILSPILFLTVFVFSAAISAAIVLGYPAHLLLIEKKAREAMRTLMITLVTMLVLGVLVFGLLVA